MDFRTNVFVSANSCDAVAFLVHTAIKKTSRYCARPHNAYQAGGAIALTWAAMWTQIIEFLKKNKNMKRNSVVYLNKKETDLIDEKINLSLFIAKRAVLRVVR